MPAHYYFPIFFSVLLIIISVISQSYTTSTVYTSFLKEKDSTGIEKCNCNEYRWVDDYCNDQHCKYRRPIAASIQAFGADASNKSPLLLFFI